MKIGAIFREAWRNVTTGTARTRRTGIAAALTVCVLASADMLATGQLVERADEFARIGGGVAIVTAAGRVDGSRCDRLAELPGVIASGALRASARQLTPRVLRSAPIPVSEVSSGFPLVLQAVIRAPGVILGPEAVDALGLNVPSALTTTSGAVHAGGSYAYPEDGRRPGLSYAALAPSPPDRPFDECWVDTRPMQDMTSSLLTTVLLAGEVDDPPTIAQLNPTQGTSFDGRVLFAERITRFAGPCAVILGFAFGFAGVRSRRLSFASALHAGATHRDLRRIVGAEAVAWVLLSAALAIPVTLLIGVSLNGRALSIASSLLVAASLWLAGFAGAWTGVATIRERYLLRYFKSR